MAWLLAKSFLRKVDSLCGHICNTIQGPSPIHLNGGILKSHESPSESHAGFHSQQWHIYLNLFYLSWRLKNVLARHTVMVKGQSQEHIIYVEK